MAANNFVFQLSELTLLEKVNCLQTQEWLQTDVTSNELIIVLNFRKNSNWENNVNLFVFHYSGNIIQQKTWT